MSWGPWFACDGTGLPADFPRIEDAKVWVDMLAPGRTPVDLIGPNWPGLFWSLRRRHWYSLRRQPVCHDPVYAPVLALRVWVPPALEQLRALAADPVREYA
jgi:hypothetical protein